MESVFPFVLLGLAMGLMIWGVSNLFVDDIIRERYFHVVSAGAIASAKTTCQDRQEPNLPEKSVLALPRWTLVC